MKVAVLSDVHANLEALSAVLEDVERRSVDRILFVGDVVGYGADPGPCLALIENAGCRCIAGNHDMAAADDRLGLEGFQDDAADGIRWTRSALSQSEKGRLAALPLESQDGELHLVHGSPFRPERWTYVLSEKDAETGFGATSSRLTLVGHSHIPSAYVEVEAKRIFSGVMRRVKAAAPDSLTLQPGVRYMLNAGSVGQPRDGDPRAAYAILDPERGAYTLHRVAYDVEGASAKIRRAGLPEALAERLVAGC